METWAPRCTNAMIFNLIVTSAPYDKHYSTSSDEERDAHKAPVAWPTLSPGRGAGSLLENRVPDSQCGFFSCQQHVATLLPHLSLPGPPIHMSYHACTWEQKGTMMMCFVRHLQTAQGSKLSGLRAQGYILAPHVLCLTKQPKTNSFLPLQYKGDLDSL
jgi:hypothetical protein